jgi:hypothetical protein
VQISATSKQYVVCPLCKGSILSNEFENHFKLETLSSASNTQRMAEQSKYVGVPLEKSAESVKRNLQQMLHIQSRIAKRRK